MGLPASPLDKMRKSGDISSQPLQTEADIFQANVETYEGTCTYVNYGAAIFYITTHKDSSHRGFDDVTCRKVVANLERARYIAGILLQCLDGFCESLHKEADYKKRREFHLTRQRQKETQESHIEKMMKKKFYKKAVNVHRSKASKLDIIKETGNDFVRYRKETLDTGMNYQHAPKTQILSDNDRQSQFLWK